MVPLRHGMLQLFQGGEPGFWASKVVIELPIWRKSYVLMRKMRGWKCLVLLLGAKRGLAIINIRSIVTFYFEL